MDLKDAYLHVPMREGFPVQSFAFRYLSGAKGLHQDCGSSAVPTSEQGHAHLPLPQRLVNLLPVLGTVQ